MPPTHESHEFVEVCCVCLVVHRIKTAFRNEEMNKAHYHWQPSGGEIFPFHATVCVMCVPGRLDHEAALGEFGWARKTTPDTFRRQGRLNASMPSRPSDGFTMRVLNRTYSAMVEALKGSFSTESTSWIGVHKERV